MLLESSRIDAVKVIGPQIGVGGVVAQQVVGHDQHAMRERDGGLEGPRRLLCRRYWAAR
jgi:hypothetical protein